MIAHRLVEVHAVEDGRVVAGEQLVGDDEDLRQLPGLREGFASRLLPGVVELVLRDERSVDRVERVLGVDRHGPLRRKVAVERLLVLGARLAIDANQERLVAQGVHVLLEVLGDELRDAVDPVVGLEERLEADGAVEDAVELLDVADAFGLGEGEELAIEHPSGRRISPGASVWRRRSVVPSSIDSLMEYLSRYPSASSLPNVLNVPRPCAVLSMGVPVKPESGSPVAARPSSSCRGPRPSSDGPSSTST
ncbi:MAG: hypothetical protein M5U28_52760 [Sandaracinaceae bacterium]|nr:hypothetical protein [Sandaracinaceae bacterium]